jgi:hypothetical protein
MPNDYTRAYKEYIDDNCNSDHCMSLKQFKEEVHRYDDETHQYIYDKYVIMVDCMRDKIDMIDPSGGPYICTAMHMGTFDKAFKGMVVKDFKQKEDGYLIIIKK